MKSFLGSSLKQDDGETSTYTVTSPNGRKMTFAFKYKYVGSSWKAYIIECPSCESKPMHGIHTHSWFDNNENLYYVDWCPDIKQIHHIKQLSKMWANYTANYIDTGRFESS